MIEWIASSCILIFIVIGLRAVLKGKIGLRLQYALWGIVLLRLLIPFNIGSAVFSVANFTARVKPAVVQTEIPKEDTQEKPSAQRNPEQSDESFGEVVQTAPALEKESIRLWPDVLYGIWIAGIAAVAVLFLATNLHFRRKILGSRKKLGIRKNNLDVYASGEIETPCLFGTLKPAIYVTCNVAEKETMLRHTLEHEQSHYRHGDHIWAILRCVCLAIHWYNPLVWWAARLSQRDAELACDEATILRLGDQERAEYGRTLIGMTCQKRGNVLMTATTMTTGQSGIKERILLIAKKPKTAIYTLVTVILVAAVAVGCTFTGAKQEEGKAETLPPVTEPSQTAGTDSPTQSTTLPTLTEPTQTLPPQESTEIATQPPETEPPKATEPENPLKITEILSATLEWNGLHTVTSTPSMNSIEKWLRNAQEIESAACPFTSKLTLETDDGRTLVLYMAADDCASFLYNGVTYSYAELTEDGYTDNVLFYSLFAPEVIHEKSRNGLDGALGYLHYLNWGVYYSQYGSEETFALLHKFETWAAEKPTYERFGCIIECGKGLDAGISEGYGHVLAALYELAPAEFAWACLGNATDEAEERTIRYLAFEWELSTEEARAKLEDQLS